MYSDYAHKKNSVHHFADVGRGRKRTTSEESRKPATWVDGGLQHKKAKSRDQRAVAAVNGSVNGPISNYESLMS